MSRKTSFFEFFLQIKLTDFGKLSGSAKRKLARVEPTAGDLNLRFRSSQARGAKGFVWNHKRHEFPLQLSYRKVA